MKLTMKNPRTFQALSGYPEDPEPVTEKQVKEQIMYWHDLLCAECESLPGDIANLEAFLYNLAEAEVEYEEQMSEYEYGVTYTYWRTFSIKAATQEEADILADRYFLAHDDEWRKQAVLDRGEDWEWNTELYRKHTCETIRENY